MGETETSRNFIDAITLDRELSAEDAIGQIASFHGTSAENIRASFFHLSNFEKGTITFERSVNGGHPCVGMTGKGEDGKTWYELIDKYTGQPMPFVG
ncbi:MAG: hypothetical protein WC817_05270 [Patescibacteria group bacterium]|jgi:hypothetical protein